MIIYPAIDLRQGRCVRLHQGQFDRETVYGEASETVMAEAADELIKEAMG